MSQTASYGQWPQTDAKKAYGMAHKWDHWTRHTGRGGERACVGDKYRKNTTHIYSSVYVSVNKAEDEERQHDAITERLEHQNTFKRFLCDIMSNVCSFYIINHKDYEHWSNSAEQGTYSIFEM